MCLPAGMMELVRPESMQPQASQRSVLGADTSAATRGARDWRQDEEETRAKHHSSLASQASPFGGGRSLPRAFLGWESRDCTRARDGGRFDILAKAVLLPQLCFIAAVARFRTVLLWLVRAAQRNTRRHSAYTARRDHSKACFQDCCAQNKSGYLRIRATDRKKRRDAVTNGQGRQGREDLQDQARPRRRNRTYGRHSARPLRGESDRETIRASYAGAASATRSRPAARTSRARTCTASSAARPARRRASPSAAPWRGAA